MENKYNTFPDFGPDDDTEDMLPDEYTHLPDIIRTNPDDKS